MGSIVVKNLGKAYKQYPSRWGRLIEWLLPDQQKPLHTLKWVLQDVSFEIAPGESVGIVGVNGAGKSTLLKMITGTTQPTTGSVEVSGRVAALLELGMGFHPDFTGRQNVIMAGQLQGMSVEEIHALMPEIEAFSGIGDYIDQPVRVYSSGMQVRLAFAVATAKRPEILIVDEALSVGDAAFQRKCFQRIEAFRAEGTTLLFVSHDIETVKKFCDRAVFLRDGRLAVMGVAKVVCDEYEAYLFGGDKKRISSEIEESKGGEGVYDPNLSADCRMIYGNGKANIVDARLEDTAGNFVNVVTTGSELCLCFEVEVGCQQIEGPCANVQVKTTDGVVVYGVNTDHLQVDAFELSPGARYGFRFELSNFLAPGVYFITCGVKEGGAASDDFCCRVVDGVVLKVVDREPSTVARGLIDLRGRFSMLAIG